MKTIMMSILICGLFSESSMAQTQVPKDSKAKVLENAEKVFKDTKKTPLSKDEIIKSLTSETQKKEKMNIEVIYDALEPVAKILEKNYDENFLVKVLNFYPNYFKLDQYNYSVELFYELYQNKQKDFDRAIDKALNKKDAKEFRTRMKDIIREAEEGNG